MLTRTPTFHGCHDESFSNWSCPSHTTISQKKTCYISLHVSWMFQEIQHSSVILKCVKNKRLSPPAAFVQLIFLHIIMLLLLRCLTGKLLFERFATVPLFSGAISPTLTVNVGWDQGERAPGGTTLSTELWFQRNGNKSFACPHRPWSTSVCPKCLRMWRDRQQECVCPWMFLQRWPLWHCMNVYITLGDRGKLSFGLSWQDVSVIILPVCKTVTIFLGPDYIKKIVYTAWSEGACHQLVPNTPYGNYWLHTIET